MPTREETLMFELLVAGLATGLLMFTYSSGHVRPLLNTMFVLGIIAALHPNTAGWMASVYALICVVGIIYLKRTKKEIIISTTIKWGAWVVVLVSTTAFWYFLLI